MKRCLMIGAGGFGTFWIRNIFPKFKDKIKIVALVDKDEKVLRETGAFLHLPEKQLFGDIEGAFREV